MTTAASQITIGLVFPELLGTYGDRGNAVILRERLRRRGLDARVMDLPADREIPSSLDCYVIGGGEDHAELTAAPLLRASPLRQAWEAGSSIVAICAGYQLLGETMTLTDGSTLEGMAMIDAHTEPGPVRHVGNIAVDTRDPSLGTIAGFENHRGVTTLGAAHTPLGVIAGVKPRDEGVLGERLVGSYLHGPFLVGNPALADMVLSWIVGTLPSIDAGYEDALHQEWLRRAAASSTRRAPRWTHRRKARA